MKMIVLLKTAYLIYIHVYQYLYTKLIPLKLQNKIRTNTLGLQLLQTKEAVCCVSMLAR